MFGRVLVANCSEIATRAFRATCELGARTAGVLTLRRVAPGTDLVALIDKGLSFDFPVFVKAIETCMREPARAFGDRPRSSNTVVESRHIEMQVLADVRGGGGGRPGRRGSTQYWIPGELAPGGSAWSHASSSGWG